MAGDETTVTKSGKWTYGLGRFFSSIYSRAVPGIGFFSLCLIGVSSRQASPLLMEQLDPAMKKYTKVKKGKPTGTGKRGRPQGSPKKNRHEVELTDYLKWIQGNIQKTLKLIGDQLQITYFVYDGAFGNNACLQMVKRCGLRLISKLQCNSALWFPYAGEYPGQGAPKKYGAKVDYGKFSPKYFRQTTCKKGVEEKIYQIQVWHRNFADLLNVTILQRRRVSDGKVAQVILFSDDLQLSWEKMLLYYRLRFQIEFTFRDAKQFWGLEDFMNIQQTPVENAANLSMFMVNLSHILARQTQEAKTSMLDLKARFHAAFYLEQLLKIHPQIQQVISFEKLQNAMTNIGCIHPTPKEPIFQDKILVNLPLHNQENQEKIPAIPKVTKGQESLFLHSRLFLNS